MKKYYKLTYSHLLDGNFKFIKIKDEQSAKLIINGLDVDECIFNTNERILKKFKEAKKYYSDLNLSLADNGLIFLYFQDLLEKPEHLKIFVRFQYAEPNTDFHYKIWLNFIDLKYNVFCITDIMKLSNDKIYFIHDNIDILKKIVDYDLIKMDEVFKSVNPWIENHDYSFEESTMPEFVKEYLLFK